MASIGNLSLAFSAITYDPLFPNKSSTCSTSSGLAPGKTCLLTTAFAPSVAGGPFTGTLTVSDDALNESAAQTSTETGTGIQLTQTINFTQPTSPAVANSSANLSATGGGSGDPVVFSVSGPATINGNTITYTAAGTVVVTANRRAPSAIRQRLRCPIT